MTAALLFLVEAAAGTCALGAPARLSGGAQVEQAVLEFEDEAAEPIALTMAGLGRSTGAAAGASGLEANDADSDAAPAQCKLAMPIA